MIHHTPRNAPAAAATAAAHEADPNAITAAGFAMALFMCSLQTAGFITRLDWIGSVAMISGIVLLMACLVHLNNGNTLHGTVSGIYGSYWLSVSLQIMAATATSNAGANTTGVAFPGLLDNLDENLTYLRIPLAIFTLYAIVATYLMDKPYVLVYGLFELQLILLIAGQQAGSIRLMHAGGWFGILSSSLAFYLSASFLVKPFFNFPFGLGCPSCCLTSGALPDWLRDQPVSRSTHSQSQVVEINLAQRPQSEHLLAVAEQGSAVADIEAQSKHGSAVSSSKKSIRLHSHRNHNGIHVLPPPHGRRMAAPSVPLNHHPSLALPGNHLANSWTLPGEFPEVAGDDVEPFHVESVTTSVSSSTEHV